MSETPDWLPPGYTLNVLDPDVLILRREDGSMVGAFSARGATEGELCRTAQEDLRQRGPSRDQAQPPSPAT